MIVKKKVINCIKLVIIFLGVTMAFAQVEATESVFELDFSKTKGSWQDLVGTAEIKELNNQLTISNTTVGTNIESVTLAVDSPTLSSGDVELDFLYEGQKNFGIVFRADETASSNWQSFAYNGDGDWQLGQPGGKWLSGIKGPRLVVGRNYKFLVRYTGTSVEAFIDGESFYQNEQVSFPNDKGEISGDWLGKVGIRLFGDRVTLKMNSLKSGPLNSISIEKEETPKIEDEKLEVLRNRWKENLVGDFEKHPELLTDPEVSNYISQLSGQATQIYDDLNRETDRSRLWDKKGSDTKSADLTTQFKNLTLLSKAYGTKGTSFYQNKDVLKEIKLGLSFMTAPGLYDGQKYYGNWWDWQVGVPQELLSSIFIIYDDLSENEIQEYSRILDFYLPNSYQQLYGKAQDGSFDLAFIPNFVTTGANRTDLALSTLGISILLKDSKKIAESVASVKDVFETVSKGDGFYEDGSFIQHNNIPYTGSYGNVLIKGVGKIFSIVSETDWEVEQDVLTKFVTNIEKAFIPLVINGEMMPMVNGRSISRAPSSTKIGFGSPTLYNLLIVSEFADENSKNRLQETSKYWMKQNEVFYYTNTRDFKDLMLAKTLMYDSNILGETKPFLGSHMYSAMDRAIYSHEDYTLGISMYSNRMSSFEAGNKENKKGWHTSDGMLYLYNKDNQFGESYWPTVDYYRLPGTTVDTAKLEDEVSAFTTIRSKENHVGGLAFEGNLISSMSLNKEGTKNNGKELPMNVRAKKSWFVIDNQIIALGAGINGNSESEIETVIENRMLNNNSSYQLLNNLNKEVANQEMTLEKNSWLLLQSNQIGESIGYVALEEMPIKTMKTNRTGTYKMINDAFPSDKEYSEDYQSIIIPHGKEVIDTTYAYQLVPNATTKDLKKITTENQVTIMANNSEQQVVKLKNITAGTIWNETGGAIGDLKIDKPSVILIKEDEAKISLTVSNPKQTAEKIAITLPYEIEDFNAESDKVNLSANGKEIIIDTTGALGASFEMNFTKKVKDIPVTEINIEGPSLQIIKKGKTLSLEASVTPENATNKTINWTVQKTDIATIENGVLTAKKTGTTRVIAESDNGVKQSFAIRVTP